MLKLLSVNIERDKHTERILDLIVRERPDVLCLQEILERDIPLFEGTFGAKCDFVPMCIFPARHNKSNTDEVYGFGMFSVLPTSRVRSAYYAENQDGVVLCDDEETTPCNRALLCADIEKDGDIYSVATTHFTWTPHGYSNARQERDLIPFLQLLAKEEKFILCGDLNAPRGMKTFETLASMYTDNIPDEYLTSLDPELHRTHGAKQFMVDALFTTSQYHTSNVRLEFGVSDHAAIIANIEKEA